MKKFLIVIMVLTILILPACADNSENAASGNENNSEQVADSNGETGDLDELTLNQLATNVFLLEKTEYQVTEEQAEEMVVLWQVAKALIESSTAAEAELTSVTNQIEAIFTDEQIAYILTLDAEEANINQILDEYGYSLRGSDGKLGEGDLSQEELEAMRAAAGGDLSSATGEKMGGGGGGGSGGFGGQDLTPEMQATREAMRAEMSGAGFGMNTDIFDAVIEFLQSKIG
jgi:hypothetical protein